MFLETFTVSRPSPLDLALHELIRRRSRTIVTTICFFSILAAGCGRSDGPVVVHPVHGQVQYDGKPAEGVRVYFFPTDAPVVPQIPANPHGVTGPDGAFRLTTYKDGDGAAEGKYLVIFSWPKAKESEHDEEAEVDRLLGWYDAAHTKFTANIVAGDNALPAYKLSRVSSPPPVSEGIPGRN
jgi:hypothetical protein